MIDADLEKYIQKEIEAGNLQRAVCIDYRPSGSLVLDRALGGGLPKGLISTVIAPARYGKTTLIMIAAARTILDGGSVLIVDSERKFDKRLFEKTVGVSAENVVFHPTTGEDGANLMLEAASRGYDLICLDSLTELVPHRYYETPVGDSAMGVQAQFNAQFLHKMKRAIALSKTSLLMVSQHREKFDQYGDIVIPGGNIVKHSSAFIIQLLSPRKDPKDGSKRTIRGKTIRTTGVAESEFELSVSMSPFVYVNRAYEAAFLGKEFSIFTNKNGEKISGAAKWYFCGEEFASSLDGAVEELIKRCQKDKSILNDIEDQIREAIKSS